MAQHLEMKLEALLRQFQHVYQMTEGREYIIGNVKGETKYHQELDAENN